MEENNKYYTPDVSEFHVGFEYIELSYLGKEKNTIQEWDFEVQRGETTPNFTTITYLLNEGKIKVKHLDREDIESLGWEQIEYDTFKLKDFYLEFNPEYSTFIYKTMKENIFKGTIKNKSELKKIMVQLGIE